MRSRRRALQDARLGPGTHPGLWLDKFLSEQNDQSQRDEERGKGEKGVHIRGLHERPAPDGYVRAFERWRDGLAADPGAHLALATATGRFVVGLGIDTVLETGIRLDRTWGVPLLPGSALKGIARRAAAMLADDDRWGDGGGELGRDGVTLFGDTDDAGAVCFLDAWWVPDTPHVPLHQDVMTVHHRAWYGGAEAPPADTDSPNPVAFVTASGTYLVAVVRRRGTDPRWGEAALGLLALGLEHLGVGAKTNAGYGRMKLAVEGAETRADSPPDDAGAVIERALAPVIQAPTGARRDWLLKNARGFQPPRDVADADWRAALRRLFPAEIEAIRAAAAGGDMPELADARGKLAEHLANVPAGKSDAKVKWTKKKGDLEGRVRQLEAQQSKRAADRDRYLSVLAWLEASAAPE